MTVAAVLVAGLIVVWAFEIRFKDLYARMSAMEIDIEELEGLVKELKKTKKPA